MVEGHDDALPERFELEQNYPNPFNSSTVVRFALPVRAPVELAVYNLMGQKVTELVSGLREAGSHTLKWDGRDDDGRELASGVYVYRLRTGGQLVQTRRMALVR